MSWGIRITLLYVGFVALILTLVITSMHNKEDLVSKDYYQQELRYEDRINAIKNTNALDYAINYKVEGNKVELKYPEQLMAPEVKGEIFFFRPSDAEKDFKVAMNPGKDGLQVIDGKKLTHGSYKMELSWQAGGKNFYKEEVIFIQ